MKTIIREPLFAVMLRVADGTMRGAAVSDRGLTKEAAERAAEAVNALDGPFVAVVRPMKWKLVGAA